MSPCSPQTDVSWSAPCWHVDAHQAWDSQFLRSSLLLGLSCSVTSRSSPSLLLVLHTLMDRIWHALPAIEFSWQRQSREISLLLILAAVFDACCLAVMSVQPILGSKEKVTHQHWCPPFVPITLQTCCWFQNSEHVSILWLSYGCPINRSKWICSVVAGIG